MLGKQEAVIVGVRKVDIHGVIFWDVAYAPAQNPQQVQQGRIGEESAYAELAAGDKVTVHAVLGTLTKIEKLDEE